jgi:hypothetical protein
MIKRIKNWADVCKVHWKEIISLAIALHWLMDLLVIVPISLAIGYFFGVHIGHTH